MAATLHSILDATPVPGVAPRRLVGPWIEEFTRYTEELGSPERFRRWTAIALVAAAVERRCWIFTRGRNFFPNLYIGLIGPPATGKGNILSFAKEYLYKIEANVAYTSLSTASLIDSLNEGARRIVDNKTLAYTEYNYLVIMATELGSFLPTYEPSFVNSLTDIYDGTPFGDKKRVRGTNIQMKNPQITMIFGTTPAALHKLLPETAWDDGFMSRVISIYSDDKINTDVFSEILSTPESLVTAKGLIHDLQVMTKLNGKLEWSSEAVAAFRAWMANGQPPVPEHPKLVHYNSRRYGQLLKLSMTASISRGNELVIRLEDYQAALNWLLEAEMAMPDLFASTGISGESKAMDELWHFIYITFKKEGKPILEGRLYNFLKGRVPNHSIPRTVELMYKMGWIKLSPINNITAFVPGEKVK